MALSFLFLPYLNTLKIAHEIHPPLFCANSKQVYVNTMSININKFSHFKAMLFQYRSFEYQLGLVANGKRTIHPTRPPMYNLISSLPRSSGWLNSSWISGRPM